MATQSWAKFRLIFGTRVLINRGIIFANPYIILTDTPNGLSTQNNATVSVVPTAHRQSFLSVREAAGPGHRFSWSHPAQAGAARTLLPEPRQEVGTGVS